MNEVIQNAKRIVIKVGSALLTNDTRDAVKQKWVNAFAEDLAQLRESGKDIIIVSSGGVALGRKYIDISSEVSPTQIPLEQKQAASAIGQFYMFQAYHKAFQKQKIETSQVLITLSETENRRMHLNARETLNVLLSKNIIPVINENDVVSTEEIRFGDNDRLAARIAQMMDADLVILLSTIDGLYTDNPAKNDTAEHIPLVENIDQAHKSMAGDALPGLSTGGMKSKIEAAEACMRAGIHMIITNGEDKRVINALIEDKNNKNTLFKAQKTDKNARKRWISSHVSPKGSLFVDIGAKKALLGGKSLLPVGVKRIEGQFERGDAVKIYCDETREELGIGLIGYSSAETQLIMGQPSHHVHTLQGYIGREELIHRNDMVLENSAANRDIL